MSIEEDDQDLLTIIWFGNESEKSKIKVKFSKKLVNIDELKEYLIDKRDSSIIIILSNDIPIDIISPMNLPQICAVYNDKLVCLYCLPSMKSLVDKYLNQNKSTISRSSYILPLLQNYWFFPGIVVVVFLAYLFPNVGKTGGYIRSEWSIKWGCVILIFFLSGLSVRTRQLLKEFLHIRLHILVQIYSLLIIPFIIYGFGLLLIKFSVNKILIVGIIMLGSTCTTVSTNVIMTKNAMGNDRAALLAAILGNIFGIFLSPAVILYFFKNPILNLLSNTKSIEKRIDYLSVIRELCLLVLIPLSLGQIIHTLWTKQVTYIRNKFHLNQLNNICLLAMLWSVFSTSFASQIFETIETKDLFILILINTGIFLGFSLLILIIARLPIPYWQFSKEDTVAIMFCGVMKSVAMGISLINAFFENENQELTGLLVLPYIIYHVQQLILGAFAVVFLKKWVKKELKKQPLTKTNDQNIQLANEDNLQLEETENININC